MSSQGTQGKLFSPLAKERATSLTGPSHHLKPKPDPVSHLESEPVLIHGDFRESSATDPVTHHRPFFAGGKIKLFGHFVPLQILLLAFVEALVFAAAGYVGLQYLSVESAAFSSSTVVPKIGAIAVVLVLCLGAIGLYSAHQRADVGGVLSRALVGFVVGLIGLEALYQFFPILAVPQDALIATGVVAATGFGLVRSLFYRYVDGSMLVRRVLVVGTGKRAKSIEHLRRKSDQRGFKVFGFVSVASNGGCIHVSSDRIVAAGQRFCQYALNNHIDEIVVALDDRRQGEVPTEELLNCRLSGIDVTDMLDFFERETAKIRLDLLRPSWLIQFIEKHASFE